jgi:Peptidase S24-like
MIDPRAALDQLIRENKEGYSALSRLIGRNPAYIQQFIKRGSPRKLDESDRKKLANYFGVTDSHLGGPREPTGSSDQFIAVPVLSMLGTKGSSDDASCGKARGHVSFSNVWLQRLTSRKTLDLAIARIAGDSMEPTLRNGDDVLVDLQDEQTMLRDGVYVLSTDNGLEVKRISVEPFGKGVSIVSDNPLYRSWENLSRDAVKTVGRVIWVGRVLP